MEGTTETVHDQCCLLVLLKIWMLHNVSQSILTYVFVRQTVYFYIATLFAQFAGKILKLILKKIILKIDQMFN